MASINWAGEIAEYLKLGADATTTRGALLASLGDAVQGAMERYMGRTLSVMTHMEVYDGNDHSMLFLRNDPVLSVSSLSVNGAAVTVGSLIAPTYPPATVVIYGSGLRYTTGNVFPAGFSNVRVTYSAGFDVPPPDIVQAGVSWAAVLFKDRDRAGLASQGAGGQTTSFTREMPPFVKTVLDKWVRWGKPC
jgi:hypothetical protein